MIDEFSRTAVPLRVKFRDVELGVATGSFFVWDGRLHLVTNWHVVTGRHFFDGTNLRADGGRPDHLVAYIHAPEPNAPQVPVEIRIRDDEEKPLWRVLGDFNTDIVALEVDLPSGTAPAVVNDLEQVDLPIRVGADAFVLGYPYGIGHAGLPIWKRGSIASEPHVFDPHNPYIYLDTASREGMSGAPVFLRSSSVLDERGHMRVFERGATMFLGVYSGRRRGADELDAQLGLVWPNGIVMRILEQGVPDVR